MNLPDLVRFSLKGVGREIRLAVVLAILGGLLGLALPIGSGILVDQVIPEVGISESSWTRLLVVTVFLSVLALSIMVLQVVEGLALLHIEGKIVPAIVPAVWDRLLRLPTRFFAEYSSGDLALRAMGLALVFKKLSGGAATTLVTGLISLFNLGLLFWYSWRLASLTLVLLGVMLVVVLVFLVAQIRQEA